MKQSEQKSLFDDAIARNRGRYVGIARAYAGRDSEVLLQEILMQIWRSLPGFQQRSSVNRRTQQPCSCRFAARSSWFENSLARRDLREHAAVFVLICFGISFFSLPTTMARVGCGIILAGTLAIMCVLI